MAQELKLNLKPDINDTLMYCPKALAIDSQVYFHRPLFANTTKLSW